MFCQIQGGLLTYSQSPMTGFAPIYTLGASLLPPIVSQLHHNFHGWAEAGFSPGLVIPDRVWCSRDGELAFRFYGEEKPQPLTHVSLARELAAWLVMLDKWMETFVVVARAREVWNVAELAGALTFTSPPFLPRQLLDQGPENWERVANALAVAVADGPLTEGDLHRKEYRR